MTLPSLPAFLLARYDEEAAEARNTADWYAPNGVRIATTYADDIVTIQTDFPTLHVQPRSLAEVEAKRQIVAACAQALENASPYGVPRLRVEWRTLRWLALPYAGHPDYREEWRP